MDLFGAHYSTTTGKPRFYSGCCLLPPPLHVPKGAGGWYLELLIKGSWRATLWGPLRGLDLKTLPRAHLSSLGQLGQRSNHPCPVGVCLMDAACGPYHPIP